MKDFETYLRIKKLVEEGDKYEDSVRSTHSSLIIRSEGMELKNTKVYQMLQVILGA